MPIHKQRRKRGVRLTPQGLCKLQNAKQQAEHRKNDHRRLTLDALSTQTGLDSHTLCKIFNRSARVDQKSLVQCFKAFNLTLEPDDYESRSLPSTVVSQGTQAIEPGNDNAIETQADVKTTNSARFPIQPPTFQSQPSVNDGFAPHTSRFYGRTAELTLLSQWIRVDRCRLVALTGQGGIGKTALAAKLVEQIKDGFEYVFWRSLHHAPSLHECLIQLIQSVSRSVKAESVDADVSTLLHCLIAQAIDALRSFRCLLILDNAETLLQSCDQKQGVSNQLAGHYCPEYEGYKLFLKHVTETNHQSCLVLTSRELPQDIRRRAGKDLPVRSLPIKGLQVTQIQAIVQNEGDFLATPANWSSLVECYAGNPLILKHVASSIQFLFGGNIAEFLRQDILLFGETFDVLDQQLERVSAIEKAILIALTTQIQPGSFSDVRSHVAASISNQQLLEGLNSLDLRSLLEINDGYFSLLPMLASAVVERYATGNTR